MFELRKSPYIPGREIDTSYREFYHIYLNDKITDRTLYTKLAYSSQHESEYLIVLNKHTIEEIRPSVLSFCREKNKNYPKYGLTSNYVVVNKITGKVVFTTNVFLNRPIVLSDYMFIYENKLYSLNGTLIKEFNGSIKTFKTAKAYIVIEGYTNPVCYVFDYMGHLIDEYK